MNPTATRALQVSTPTETTIVLTRTFNAPRRLVWEAMFTPDKMRRWMLPPPGWTTTICECEPRMAGALRLVWKSEEADPAMTLHGVFTEAVVHERMVHTETMVLGSGQPIGSQVETHEFAEKVTARRKEAKTAVKAAEKREKKRTQEAHDTKLEELTEILTVAKEANWLYEKFGDGEYKDILGLCKVAYTTEVAKGDNERICIEEKGWSLTPGAYVGVPPLEDDGVDFEERMDEIHRERLSLRAEANALMDTSCEKRKEMGIG